VTFKDGNITVATRTYYKGDIIREWPEYTKNKFELKGWRLQSLDGIRYVQGQEYQVNSDVNFFADLEQIKFTVRLHKNYDNIIEEISFVKGGQPIELGIL